MTPVSELTIEQKIEQALDQIRPFLREDGGNIHLVDVSDDLVVRVHFSGACTECSMQNSTFKAGVEESILRTIPEIKKVVTVSI